MVANEVEYYKAKSKLLELQLNENRLMIGVDRIRKEREAIFVSLNLDPNKNYKFTDENCTIEEA